MMSISHQSCRTKIFMSIWRVRFVGCWAEATSKEPWLYSYSIVCVMLRDSDTVEDRAYVMKIFPASTVAINSSSVVLSAIVSWRRNLQSITTPASMITMPVTDLQWFESPTQWESLIPIKILLNSFRRSAMDLSS